MATNSAANFAKPIGVVNGGTGVASFTTYAPLCGGTTSTSALQQSTAGLSTSGNVLVSSGSGALPTWVSIAALSKITTLTASTSANLTFDSTQITSAYSIYFIEFSQVIGDTGGNSLDMVISTDGGSSYLATGYHGGSNRHLYNATTLFNSASTTQPTIFPTASAGKTSGYMYINMPPSASCSYVGQGYTQSASSTHIAFYGLNTSTTTITNLRFLMSGGNILSGSITLYGIRK